MDDIRTRLNNVNQKLDALSILFQEKPDSVMEDEAHIGDVEIKTLIDQPGFLIVLATYKKKNYGLPMHKHNDSVEYLVNLKGISLLKLPDNNMRIMDRGECATIPAGIDHTTIPMSDNAEILAICIPPELAYAKVTNGDH